MTLQALRTRCAASKPLATRCVWLRNGPRPSQLIEICSYAFLASCLSANNQM